MTIGNINSQEVGSGARYNDGKPPIELIPLYFVAELMRGPEASYKPAYLGMIELAGFQVGGGRQLLASLLVRASIGAGDQTGGNFRLDTCAKVFDYGRGKYAEWNWAKGMPWSVPIASAARHLLSICEGEVNDPESGLPHWGHVACNVIMLLTYIDTYPDGDDRPKYLKAMLKNGA